MQSLSTVHFSSFKFEFGVVVQLVRTPACHAGGRGFESRRPANLRSRALTSRELRFGKPRKRLPTHLSDRRTIAQCATAVPDSQALLAARAEAAIAAKAVTAHSLTLPTCEPRLASPTERSYGRHDQPLGLSPFRGAVVRSAYVLARKRRRRRTGDARPCSVWARIHSDSETIRGFSAERVREREGTRIVNLAHANGCQDLR